MIVFRLERKEFSRLVKVLASNGRDLELIAKWRVLDV